MMDGEDAALFDRFRTAMDGWRKTTDRLARQLPGITTYSGARAGVEAGKSKQPLSATDRQVARLHAIEARIRSVLDGDASADDLFDPDSSLMSIDASASSKAVSSLSASQGLAALGDTGAARPWDIADYGARVSSFRVHTWFGKPDRVGPLECARFGWCNTGPDKLSCKSCGSVLVFGSDVAGVGIGAMSSATSVGGLAEAFHARLSDAHDGLCVWRSNCSPETFATVCPVPSGALAVEFVRRAVAISASLTRSSLAGQRLVTQAELASLALQAAEPLARAAAELGIVPKGAMPERRRSGAEADLASAGRLRPALSAYLAAVKPSASEKSSPELLSEAFCNLLAALMRDCSRVANLAEGQSSPDACIFAVFGWAASVGTVSVSAAGNVAQPPSLALPVLRCTCCQGSRLLRPPATESTTAGSAASAAASPSSALGRAATDRSKRSRDSLESGAPGSSSLSRFEAARRAHTACMAALTALSAAKRSKGAAAGEAAAAPTSRSVEVALASWRAVDGPDAAQASPAAMHRWFCPWVSARVALPTLPAELVAWDGSADDEIAPSPSAGVVAIAMAPVAVAERRRTLEALQMLARCTADQSRRASRAATSGATAQGWVALLVALVLAIV